MRKISNKISILIITISTIIIMTSCSHFVDGTFTKNYEWEKKNFSDPQNFLELRSDLSIKDNAVLVYEDSDKGTWGRLNFSCGNLGMDYGTSGIDIDVWMNSNVHSVGIQMYEPEFGGTQFYWFYLTRNGNIGASKNYRPDPENSKNTTETGLKWIKYTTEKNAANKMHNFKSYFDDDNNMHVLFDKYEFCTIPADEVLFTEGNFFIVYQLIPDQQYTEQNAANAKFILKKQQKKVEK